MGTVLFLQHVEIYRTSLDIHLDKIQILFAFYFTLITTIFNLYRSSYSMDITAMKQLFLSEYFQCL